MTESKLRVDELESFPTFEFQFRQVSALSMLIHVSYNLKLRKSFDDIEPIAFTLSTGIACEKTVQVNDETKFLQVLQVIIVFQTLDGKEIGDKVYSEVQLVERFTRLKILDGGDVINRQVEIFEFFKPSQVFDFRNEVILKKKDF